jgi:IS5 family transposase
MMDYTFLCKAYGVLKLETWQSINESLSGYALEEEKITEEKVRVDTTVYETNVHYPTDSSLLWDSFRTLSRLMKQASEEMMAAGLMHRFHVKKVKKLAHFISRNGSRKDKGTQRKIKSVYRELIDRVNWIAGVGRTAGIILNEGSLKATAVAAELKHYVPIVEKITAQADSRVFRGEMVSS